MSRIFMSYRRDETANEAGRLYDDLTVHFGRENIFMDIDNIELGVNFLQVIQQAVGSCDVLIALIGKDWLIATDKYGRRKIDNPIDFVRLEIEAALDRGIRVIPVLVRGATMPSAEDLPESLSILSQRHALELIPRYWKLDVSKLITTLESVLSTKKNKSPIIDVENIIQNNNLGSGIKIGGSYNEDVLHPTASQWSKYTDAEWVRSGWLYPLKATHSVAVAFFKIHVFGSGKGYIHVLDAANPTHTIWFETSKGIRFEQEFSWGNTRKAPRAALWSFEW